VISALDASSPSSARDGISLVITTDLLSEGVNLQGASVIVHLDIPWTPAGLDQRVGRAARMGSPHSRVYVHGIAAPAAAERMLVLDRRLTRKRAEQAEAARAPREIEQLHALVRSWRTILGKPNFVRANVRPNVQNAEGAPPDMPAPLVANVLAAQTGFIAVLENGAGASLVCGTFRGRGGSARWTVSDAPGDLCDAVRTVRMRGAPADEAFEAGARAALNRWLARRSARESTGVAAAPSRARRELLARIDAAIRRSPAHVRATSGERIARVRALIAQAVSAGAEHALEQLARLAAADLETILNGCETALTGGAMRVDQSWPAEPRAERSPSAPRSLRALLLLRRSP
jgi:hypothetical protein